MRTLTGLHAIAGKTSIMPAMRPRGHGLCHAWSDSGIEADQLEVNALVLRWGSSGPPVVLMSLDLLYVGDSVRRELLRRVSPLLTAECLFTAATHTHHAPLVDPTKPALGTYDPEYANQVIEACCSLINELLAATPRSVQVLSGTGVHSAGVNRRLRRLLSVDSDGIHYRPVIMAPNQSSDYRPELNRLRFVDGAHVVADLWSTALHPTAFPLDEVISSDFPGTVRHYLREGVGRAHPVVFLQGFSGDIRPASPRIPFGLKRLLMGPLFAKFSEDEYRGWADQLARAVEAVPLEVQDTSRLETRRLPIQSRDLVVGAPGPSTGAIHTVVVGDTVLLGVPAEVCNAYVRELSRQDIGNTRKVWGVGCVDHVWGYAPTTAMLTEGGYESQGFCSPFAVEHVNPAVEENLRRAIRSALQ